LSSSSATDEATLAEVRSFAIARCDPNDAAHDALHLQRVVANACAIASDELGSGSRIDLVAVEAAAWLHDIVLLPKGQGSPGEAARRSAELAASFLRDCGVEAPRIDIVTAAIEAHSFSGGRRPEALEAQIVQDADRLDALGAVGIARFWVTMQRLGGRMYNPEQPLPIDRPLDDRAWALDHIERKLLRLVGLMNTSAGRREAERRTEFIRTYRDEFLREIAPPEGT